MKKILLLTFFLLTYSAFSQVQQIQIDATIIGADTNAPISYANIGIKGKALGTVSNEFGDFKLNINKRLVTTKDTLIISYLGYTTKFWSLPDFLKTLENTRTIELDPEISNLPMTSIKSVKRQKKTLGYMTSQKNIMGYWKDKRGLGGEIATQIKIRDDNTRLENFRFEVTENQADSLLIRFNLYSQEDNSPKQNLLFSDIFHTISGKGTQQINLKPYNIIVNDNVVASIELIKVYGDTIKFAVASSGQAGMSYLRLVSQSDWIIKPNMSMAFSIDVSIPENSEANRQRKQPNSISIYWDSSLSQEGDHSKPLELVEAYLNSLPKETTVEAFSFSNTTKALFSGVNTKQNTQTILKSLSQVNYNGQSKFPKKIGKPETDLSICFTDGEFNFFELSKTKINSDLFFVNQKRKGKHEYLQNLSFIYDGDYINLSSLSVEDGLKHLQNYVTSETISQKPSKPPIVNGYVTEDGAVVQGAVVSIKGTLTQGITDAYGFYSISAQVGDVLDYEFLSSFSKEKKVGGDKRIDVDLVSKFEKLEEVGITGGAKKDKDRQPSALEIQNKRLNTHSGQTLKYEDFPKSAYNLAQLIKYRFPVAQVRGQGIETQVFVRGRSSLTGSNTASFVIDDVPIAGFPFFIDPQQIAQITLVKSIAGGIRYGTNSRNGLFIIKTKGTLYSKRGRPVDSLLVKGNNYEENVLVFDPNSNQPNYLRLVNNANRFAEAKELYFSSLQQNRNNIAFYVDMSDAFKKWDADFSKTILSNILEVGGNNPKALRTYAYKLDEAGEFKASLQVYNHIFQIAPKSAQAYFDLAQSYSDNRKYSEAFGLYKLMLANNKKEVDFSGLLKSLETEMLHLLTLHRDKVPYKELSKDWLASYADIDIRMLFQWNAPQTEFTLQFVNPKSKYFSWNHSIFNKEIIEDELANDYATKEFIIQDSENGKWLINAENKTKTTTINPTYLKYAVYKNYGKTDETRTIKVLPLFRQEKKISIDTFTF